MRNHGSVIPWTLEVPLFIGMACIGNYPDLDCRMLIDDDGDLYGVELDVTQNGRPNVIEVHKEAKHPLAKDIWDAALTEAQTPKFRAAVREGITESLLDAAERKWAEAV